ncbi:MAG: NAD(P)H-binding protein [Bacteroidota bacterium]|nr:NAD(P)H-binding protein [Flavisolibacter sp.]MBD0366337.1 NAD(P)H-binding protein [Flavisolibacter sp.]MBD0374467.1 NAD(P)H-binding protein [Flavisolibacter sp.]MDQ3843244.1 NAD(P)H-binding protein [Bacteroidota bacterium]
MKLCVPKLLNNAIRHHEVLKESGLKWVISRAPQLTNDPKTGKYRTGWVGVNASTKISRGDFADFILRLVEDECLNYQMPFANY